MSWPPLCSVQLVLSRLTDSGTPDDCFVSFTLKSYLTRRTLFADGLTKPKWTFRTGLWTLLGEMGCVSPCLLQQVNMTLCQSTQWYEQKVFPQLRIYLVFFFSVVVVFVSGKWSVKKCSDLHGYVCKRRTASVLETPREPHYIGRCPEKWLYFGHKVWTLTQLTWSPLIYILCLDFVPCWLCC